MVRGGFEAKRILFVLAVMSYRNLNFLCKALSQPDLRTRLSRFVQRQGKPLENITQNVFRYSRVVTPIRCITHVSSRKWLKIDPDLEKFGLRNVALAFPELV